MSDVLSAEAVRAIIEPWEREAEKDRRAREVASEHGVNVHGSRDAEEILALARSHEQQRETILQLRAALSECGESVGQLRGERDATSDTLEADRQEIARLREFGEHYSGAAQDAWDRIAVLEKALRHEFFSKLRDLDYEEAIVGSGDVEDGGPVYDWAWAQHPWFALLGLSRDECVAYLRAGSASPGGAAEPCPSCGPDGTNQIHFDRSLCACGSMHHYCDVCGLQTEDCDDHPAAAPVSTEKTP